MTDFLKDRLILVSFLSGLALNIILWIGLLSNFGFAAKPVPLHFNIVFGIDFLGSSRKIYQLPGASLLILVLNFFLAKTIYQSEKLFSYFLSVAAAIIQVLLFLAALSLSQL